MTCCWLHRIPRYRAFRAPTPTTRLSRHLAVRIATPISSRAANAGGETCARRCRPLPPTTSVHTRHAARCPFLRLRQRRFWTILALRPSICVAPAPRARGTFWRQTRRGLRTAPLCLHTRRTWLRGMTPHSTYRLFSTAFSLPPRCHCVAPPITISRHFSSMLPCCYHPPTTSHCLLPPTFSVALLCHLTGLQFPLLPFLPASLSPHLGGTSTGVCCCFALLADRAHYVTFFSYPWHTSLHTYYRHAPSWADLRQNSDHVSDNIDIWFFLRFRCLPAICPTRLFHYSNLRWAGAAGAGHAFLYAWPKPQHSPYGRERGTLNAPRTTIT